MLLQVEQLTKWQLFSLKMITSTILSEIDVILCICSAWDRSRVKWDNPQNSTLNEDLSQQIPKNLPGLYNLESGRSSLFIFFEIKTNSGFFGHTWPNLNPLFVYFYKKYICTYKNIVQLTVKFYAQHISILIHILFDPMHHFKIFWVQAVFI